MISSNDSQMIGKNWPAQLQSVKWVKPMKFYGNSDDEKPVGSQIPNGSKFLEIDTGTQYRYDSENEEWFEQPGAGGGGGSSTLAGLTDVDISNPTDGQTLVYNATSQKWENGESDGNGILYVGIDVSTFTLDKTWQEIYNANMAVLISEIPDENVKSEFLLSEAYIEGEEGVNASYGVIFYAITIEDRQPSMEAIAFYASSRNNYPTIRTE